MPKFNIADLIAVGHYREMHASPKVHREGPSIADFVADLPHEDEGRVVAYLHAGWRYGGSDFAEFDILNPESHALVSFGEKTDGVYTWPAGLAYYVENYHVRLPEPWLRHMATVGWSVPIALNVATDGVAPDPAVANLDLQIPSDAREPYVVIRVDGVDLGGRIKEALGDAGFDNVLPAWGMDFSLDDTVFGAEMRSKGRAGAILLACSCGMSGCSEVTADVHVTDTTVTWSGFATWRQKRVVAALDPVVFDRSQFEKAVTKLLVEVGEWAPPPADSWSDGRETPPLLALPKPEP